MNASEKLNVIARVKRSQATKDRIAYGHAIGSARPESPEEREELIAIQIKTNKLEHCGAWLYLREFLETGESKIVNALLCKLPFLCEICAIRRQAKQFSASLVKVQHVMSERPELRPVMITRTIKSGPDLQRQADHFRTSREKMQAAVRRNKSAACRNQGSLELSKVEGQIRSYEVKRAAGNAEHWHFHEHIFALVSDEIDQAKLSQEWHDVTGDSFIVDARDVVAKDGYEVESSGLVEVIKYPLKFEDLAPGDAWHVNAILSRSQMTNCLGILRGIKPGSIESDEPLEDESGPYRDFVARWIANRECFQIDTVEEHGEKITNMTNNEHRRFHDDSRPAGG